MIGIPPVCIRCNHFAKNETTIGCIAFPEGIPEIIISGENDHSKPLPDQGNDIIFEPVE